MISLRYHLVTIVAVFLALALGLLAGSSFGQPALVNQLRDRTESQLQRIEELRTEVDTARADSASLETFAASAVPYLIRDELEGYRAVVVTQEGVASAAEDAVIEALKAAGAEVLLTVSALPALVDPDPETAARLAALLEVPTVVDGGDLGSIAGSGLAARLGSAIAPRSEEADLLSTLLDEGFLAARDGALDEEVRRSIHAGQLVVVVIGGAVAPGDPLTTRSFAEAVAVDLGDLEVAVAACEPRDAVDPWVGDLSTDRIVTVVGIDEVFGPASLVLGLRARLDRSEGIALGGDSDPIPSFP